MSHDRLDVKPPLRVRELTIDHGLDIAMWRAPGPWTVEDSLKAPQPDEGYWAVCDADGTLVGYCCFGEKARPPGLAERPGTLDVALGLDPARFGQGVSRLLASAAVERGRQVADHRTLRCAVASWNAVGRHTTEAAGFVAVGSHEVKGGSTVVSYTVYEM
ncbi:MAG: GNAT family N-acetyltransferase [Dermatophilaceae bacterium]